MTEDMEPTTAPSLRPYLDLPLAKIRAVTAFNASCAELVLGLFEAEHPQDARPRDAVEAAWAFASGEPRSRRQRTTAVSAHRAAKAPGQCASHAAMAAGDAAASAYPHPLARATQVGHILRGPSHAALALRKKAGGFVYHDGSLDVVLERLTPAVIEVLFLYPQPSKGASEVSGVMSSLDSLIRRMAGRQC
ncbi:hypothetical protein GCM10027418_18860 [Mariniluteicoccus endophyticus]